MSGTQLNTELRLTADNSDLLQKTAQVKTATAEIGDVAQKTGAQASAGLDKASGSARSFASSAANARDIISTLGPATSSAANQVTQQLASLIGGIDPVVGKLNSLDAQLEQLKKFRSSGALSGEDFLLYAANIETARGAINATGEAEKVLTLNTSTTRREFGLLVKDLASGNFGQAQRELGTLAGTTGIVGLAFSAMGALIIGTLVAVVAAVALLVSAHNEIDGFNRELILTGNYAGTTAQGLAQLTTEVGDSTGHYSEAQKALTLLVATGRFAGDALKNAAQGAVDFATLTGESVEKAVAIFDRIAQDPVKAAEELNAQYHFLTAAQYEQIAALQEEGQKTNAAALETELFTKKLADRKAEYLASQGELAKGWGDVKTAIDKALNSSNNFFNHGVPGGAGINLADFANPLGFAIKIGNALSVSPQVAAQAQLKAATDAATASQKSQDDAVQQFGIDAAKSFNQADEALKKQLETQGHSHEAQVQAQLDAKISTAQVTFEGQALDNEVAILKNAAQGAIAHARALDQQEASQKASAAAAREMVAANKAWADDLPRLTALESALSENLQGPYLANQNAYNAAVKELKKDYDDAALAGKLTQEVQTRLGNDEQAAYNRLQDANAQTRVRLDLGNQLIQKLSEENEQLLQGTNAERAWQLVEKISNDAIAKHTDLFGNDLKTTAAATEKVNEQRGALEKHVQSLLDDNQKLKENEQINQQWISIVSNGLDSFGNSIAQFVTGGIKNWHSFWQSLLQDTQQFVAAIIQQMLKLTLFNGIVNNLFGLNGTSQQLPTGLGNGLLGQLFSGASSGGGAAGGAAGDAASGGFSLFSPSTWVDAGKNLYSGFSSFAFGNAGNAVDAAGTLQYAPSVGGASTGFFNSSLADQIGGANGSWGGAVGSVLGGAIGGFELGKQLFGSTAGGIATGAAAATAAYFVPVIGWAFAVASLVNSLTGGNVFGTDYAPTGQTSQDISINAGGDASVQDFYQEHKHGALFTSGKYKDVAVDAPQAQTDALTAFTKQLLNADTSAAAALGTDIADTVTGSFHAAYDKNGKAIVQQSTVLGVTRDESAADFQARELADNLIAQVNKALGSDEASKIAEQYQENAQTLFDAAQMLVAAQVDVHNGMSLLGDDHSLTDIAAEVAKLQAPSESLVQTYVRLQAETQDVQATLDAMGQTTTKVGADFVQYSDDLVKAAGSLDNLNSLTSAYYQAFYTPAEQAAAKLKADTSTRDKLFAGIGQDPNESMQQFKDTFKAVFDTLSPADVVKWYQAGLALAAVNQDLGTTADVAAQAKQQYESFIQPYRDAVAGVTNFEAAVRSMGQPLSDAIDQANALAKAQGLQGASAGDVAAIIQTFSVQGANALAQFQQETQAIASKLYGADYLQGLLDDYKKTGNIFDIGKIQDAQGAQVKQQDNSRYLDAYQLASNASQIAAFTGGNVEDILKSMGVPLGALASDLKLQGTSLEDYLGKLEDQAKINMDILDANDITNKLLQDILDVARGAPLTYVKPSDFGFTDPSTAQPAAGSGKPVGRGVSGPVIVTPQPVGVAPAAPPTSSGDGGDGDVGKQIGRVGDAVASIPSALGSQGSDVKAALASVAAAVLQLNATINRYGLARPTQPVTN